MKMKSIWKWLIGALLFDYFVSPQIGKKSYTRDFLEKKKVSNSNTSGGGTLENIDGVSRTRQNELITLTQSIHRLLKGLTSKDEMTDAVKLLLSFKSDQEISFANRKFREIYGKYDLIEFMNRQLRFTSAWKDQLNNHYEQIGVTFRW